MKTGLVSAIVVAVLLVGFLALRKPHEVEVNATGSHSSAVAAAPESPVVLSEETGGPEEPPRSTAAPAPVASPGLAADLATSTTAPVQPIPEVEAPIDEARLDDDEFAAKYAGKSVEARRDALESLRLLLDRNAASMSEKQVADRKREIEWLAQHDSP